MRVLATVLEGAGRTSIGASASDRNALFAVLAVSAGSFLGALGGVLLTFPLVGAAVLFLPYAVLCTALVLSPPRHWWRYLLASSLGNLLPHLDGGADLTFFTLAEIANYSRAVVAAVGIRWLGSRRARVDYLRGMSMFLLFAAGLGPLVGASLGALAVVATRRSGEFWLTWQEWFLSNALTALILIPILLGAVRMFRKKSAIVPRSRLLEATALMVGLMIAGASVLAFSRPDVGTLAVRLYWPLPFLLWIAARFSPAAVGGSLLLVTSLTVWGAFNGRGPFIADSPTHNLLNLQLFLAALSLPPLLLSSLVAQARRTAVELSESREQYRSVVDDQTEMICRFLPDGTYTFVNAAYAAAHGGEPRAFVGRNMRAVLDPETHAATLERVALITRQTELVMHDVQVTGRDGEPRWQQWRDRGFFDASGNIREYQSVGRDVTDRWRADEEKRRLEAQTEIALALRDADRRKDEFLAMLGHELRNPLAPVRMAVELLRYRGPPDPDSARAHEILTRQVRHMTRLVDDLLDVSRITRGAIELRWDVIDLREIVANGIETTAPVLDARKHQTAVSVPDEPLWVRGDATRLGQVVGNLLHNAAKYTAAAGRIELEARREGEHAVLSVRDNGIGIPPESLGRVFELFAQASNRRDMARGGLGIGLTLVQRLVQLHGGTVEARSDGSGRGSEFTVKLPAATSEAPRAAPSVESDARASKLEILVVDDNLDAAQTLALLLSRWGHAVHTAHDGVAALEAAQAFAPDVVLLDLDLPEIDGFEVARLLREGPRGSRVVIAAVTGFGLPHHVERTRQIGFDHHFVKPVDVPSLRALLRRAAVSVSAAAPRV